MFSPFSPNAVRPCMPLRKPSSSPVALCASPRQPMTKDGAPVTPTASANGSPLSVSRDTSVESGSMAQASICTYCGQQGNFRCKRCKKTPYCSVACQTEDWKAHRHMCKPVDPEPAKEPPKDTKALPVARDGAGPLVSKCDASSPQRIFLNNLHITKVIKGSDIQASVVEFYSPGRFFILAQSPEVMKALQRISTELQKTYQSPPVTTYIPCVGEVCAVQFSCDLNWYRGLVQTLAADQKTANILYIDFGNEENVPVDRIKPLTANIQLLCPCAMECRVARVVPVADNWSDKCCVAMQQLLVNKTVSVLLVESVDHSRIHIVDIMLPMGKQLSSYLIEEGYAAEETVNITPTEQEIEAMVNASLENFRRLAVGKDDNTWAQPPKPQTQAVGDSFAAVVTHMQSPSEMVVQKVENAGALQQLQLKLREHCCQVTVPQNFRPAPGTVCCAQFSEASVSLAEDKEWYRAKVLAYSSEDRVCVGYLDFGNSEEVDLGHMRPISPSLLSLPIQAMICGLAGVEPVGGSWSEECVLALQRRLFNRILLIEIQGEHEGKLLVAIIDEASDPQANVAELLSSAGFAAPAPVSGSSDQKADQTPATETEQHVSSPAREPLVWSYAELPCNGQAVSVRVSGVKTPQEFYCCINGPTDCQQLIELKAELEEHCNLNASTFEPKVGEPCCALFPADGVWSRAMVNGVSEDKVSVTLVDCGHCIEVDKNCLRSITPRFLTLPFQAIVCSLAGVEPMGSEWTSEALLWFQNLVVDQQLSACVLSISEQVCNVKLESRGQDVATALISEQLAKAPGVIAKETCAATGSEVKCKEKKNDNELSQSQGPTLNHTSPKEMPAERTTTPAEDPSFPVDWKTMKLPLKETFQPYIAAVISPSLFYLLVPIQVNQEKLQDVMAELAAYCNKASVSSAVRSRPAPGAACCAQFSADSIWYRAVILEVGDTEMSVIYADFGNTEKVPISHVLPIPMHLLQLPFSITRCTLTGEEQFPAEWPKEVNQIFQMLLLNGGFATVEAFDGSANVLSLALLPEKGGGNITALILDALQACATSNPSPSTTQKAEQTDSGTSCASAAAGPECPPPKSTPETQKGLEDATDATGRTTPPEKAHWTPEKNSTSAASSNEDPVQKVVVQMEPLCSSPTHTTDPPTSGCCCLSLMTKIDHLEQLLLAQLSLMDQLVGRK